jgi:hypothetical protein
MKTGRNDPCPCGSGKKYKHCCLGKPLLNKDLDLDLDLDLEFGSSPIFIEGAYDDRYIDGYDIDGYMGLLPEQMQRLMHEKMNDLADIVTINKKLDSSDIADVPIIRYLDFLLFLYSRNQNALPLTSKGCYRHTIVDTFNRELFPYNKSLLKLGSEDYSLALRQVHSLLRRFSFVDENASSSRLNERGLELLAQKNYQKFYLDFLNYALYEADWVDNLPIARLRLDHFRFFQKTAIFSFLLLKNKAVSFTDYETLYDAFVRAFPDFDPDKNSDDSLIILPALYKVLFLINFSHVYGLVEYDIEEEMLDVVEDALFKTTKLFKKLFTWQV